MKKWVRPGKENARVTPEIKVYRRFSDKCTKGPEWWHCECCVAHDIAYGKSWDIIYRLKADLKLAWCVGTTPFVKLKYWTWPFMIPVYAVTALVFLVAVIAYNVWEWIDGYRE